MRTLVISTHGQRPHIVDGDPCWCKPEVQTCECPAGPHTQLVHKDPTITEDRRERMTTYSEQRQYW